MSDSVGARLWRRYLSLVFTDAGGKRLSLADLRTTFSIRQFDIQSPNTADIFIYNMSEELTEELKREYTKISVWCGYEQNFSPIFEGSIKQFRSGRSSPTDTYFNVKAADGDTAYTQAVINRTLSSGSTAGDILAAILEALAPFGITRGSVAPLPPDRSPRAIVLSGMVRDVLREQTQSWGMNWTFQNNRLNIHPLAGRALENTAVVLNSATGMIGRPEQTIEGVKVRSLLNPQIVSGSTIHINNRSIQEGQYDLSYLGEVQNELLRLVRITEDGFYRVIAADHTGDTNSNDWYTDIICVALGDPITIPQAQRGRT